MTQQGGWIGVDLDGTLAHYDEWIAPAHIGAPIMPMVNRVRKWLQQGIEVRIMTARVSKQGWEADAARSAIEAWCLVWLGYKLPVTHEKDYGMIELYDDRAVQVEQNTGRIIGHSTRGYTP